MQESIHHVNHYNKKEEPVVEVVEEVVEEVKEVIEPEVVEKVFEEVIPPKKFVGLGKKRKSRRK